MSAKTSVTALLTFDRLDFDRLRDFFNLINKLKYINEIVAVFKLIKYKFKSARLRNLVTFHQIYEPKNVKLEDVAIKRQPDVEEEGLFPDITKSIAEFEAMIVWQVGPNNERLPEPF